jgi:hypothetical protein
MLRFLYVKIVVENGISTACIGQTLFAISLLILLEASLNKEFQIYADQMCMPTEDRDIAWPAFQAGWKTAALAQQPTNSEIMQLLRGIKECVDVDGGFDRGNYCLYQQLDAVLAQNGKRVMQCATCWNCLTVCKKGYQLDNKPCGDYEPRYGDYGNIKG